MSLRLALATTLLGIAMSAPLQAADVSTLDCVRDRLSPETLDGLTGEATAMALRKPGSDSSEAEMMDLFNAARGCQGAHGWSSESRDIAAHYTQATIMFAGAKAVMRTDGYDPVALEASLRALRPEILNSIVSGKTSTEAAEAVLLLLAKQHGRRDIVAVQRAGYFAGMMVEVDRQRAAFASS